MFDFTETEGFEKLFYFEESENECAKERTRFLSDSSRSQDASYAVVEVDAIAHGAE